MEVCTNFILFFLGICFSTTYLNFTLATETKVGVESRFEIVQKPTNLWDLNLIIENPFKQNPLSQININLKTKEDAYKGTYT